VIEANLKYGHVLIQVTNKATPHEALYNTRMYMCQTRIYPTPKVKRPKHDPLWAQHPSSKMAHSPTSQWSNAPPSIVVYHPSVLMQGMLMIAAK
jgi:hypothetical protein